MTLILALESSCDETACAIIKDGKLVTSGNMEEVVKNQSLEDLFMEVTTDDK